MTVTRGELDQREGTLPAEADAGPTAARIRLGAQLRRLELGRTAIKARDLTDLLALYGVNDEAEREGMLALSRHGSAPGWWQGYGDAVPAWVKPYLGLEQAARLIRSYDVQLIPGPAADTRLRQSGVQPARRLGRRASRTAGRGADAPPGDPAPRRPAADVVYLEQLTSASYPSSPADLAYYWNMLNQLATEADPPIASAMILNQIRREL
jgi:hypothetical protein